MPMVPFDVSVNFFLAAGAKDIKLTQSLEALAMNTLGKSSIIEDTMLAWLMKWGH